MNKFLLCILLATATLNVVAQSSDLFSYSYSPDKDGASFTFKKGNNSFSLHVNGKSVKPAKPLATPDANQHYIDADGLTLQLSTVPMPGPLPASFHINNLTVDQQKEILSGYVNYEMDYLKNELKVKYTSFIQKWNIVNDRLYIVWMFNMPKGTSNVSSQLYTGTICYDHVLTINAPILNKAGYKDKAEKSISNIASSLKIKRP